MKIVGIVAEFNPFHNGHLHLVDYCKTKLNADYIIVVMSGDFVQRGAPALTDKFTRTKMALSCGADICLELPIYYSTGSAEFFAKGAVSILDKLGIVDELVFGSECGDIVALSEIATTLSEESNDFKSALDSSLKKGSNFAKARQDALLSVLNPENDPSIKEHYSNILNSSNNILGIEYIKAIILRNSSIKPLTIQRIGEDYKSEEINNFSSATAIRAHILKHGLSSEISNSMPSECFNCLKDNSARFADMNELSKLLLFKLLEEKKNGYEKFLDITKDFSNKILSNLEKYTTFDDFCMTLKSKDLTYSRISRNLIHILLNITSSNMDEYKEDDFTSFVRILGMKKAATVALKKAKDNSSLPIISNLKQADSQLDFNSKRLLDETLYASKIYNLICSSLPQSEYRMKQIII
ncbi:nucleotidyltransferase [Butyrivibrio sp. YAB3001]|uniref:nucleotidyltransferase n=1 Tax=Butyrivibrio sp. YAB3001 TaxID=1520812 RepID=UPI0008F68D60|nr:nucleotidyltransferase [Butyrivibrio sp. YAB3001]SFC37552.1 Predicted nucleotidyltransferase [Butyrivibrio sp. YAB3001]